MEALPRPNVAEREALVEATNGTLKTYATLATRYEETLERQHELIQSVDLTLDRVRQILDGVSL